MLYALLALIALVFATPANAQVHVDIGIHLPAPPPLVVVPGVASVQYAPSAPANVFFYSNQYWIFANGGGPPHGDGEGGREWSEKRKWKGHGPERDWDRHEARADGPGREGPGRDGPDRDGRDRGGPDRGGPDRGGPDRGGQGKGHGKGK